MLVHIFSCANLWSSLNFFINLVHLLGIFLITVFHHNRNTRLPPENDTGNWLLQPLRVSNLQLFALTSVWVSSKVSFTYILLSLLSTILQFSHVCHRIYPRQIHDTCPLSAKSLNSLGEEIIEDQHFTTRDFVEAVT